MQVIHKQKDVSDRIFHICELLWDHDHATPVGQVEAVYKGSFYSGESGIRSSYMVCIRNKVDSRSCRRDSKEDTK